MHRNYWVILATMLLSACNSGGGQDQAQTAPTQSAAPAAEQAPPFVPRPKADFAQVRRGGELFEKNCAVCHGQKGEGGANWRQRDASGKFPPPPLNGTGHAWHHPMKILRYVIKNGSPGGQGNMPAWKDKLSDAQIDEIIAWMQAQWPDQAYQAWYQINQRAQK